MKKKFLSILLTIALAVPMSTSVLTASAAEVPEISAAVIEFEKSGHIHPQWSDDGQWYYSILKDGSAVIMGCKRSQDSDDSHEPVEYKIPETVDGHIVTVIGGDQYYSRPFGEFMWNKCTLFIPSTVTYIRPSFLSGLHSESTIIIDLDNKAYTTVDNCVYSKDMKTLVSYRGTSDSFVVPNFVETIGEKSFYSSKIKSVKLGDNVKRIENSAFGNSSLEIIELNEGLEFIGSSAFDNTELNEINFPSTLKTIGAGAFCYTKLKKVELNSGLATVGVGAFSGLELTDIIKVPDGCSGIVSGYSILDNDFVFELKNDENGKYYFVLTDYRPSKAQEELVIPDSVFGIPVKCVDSQFYYYVDTDEEKENLDKVKKLVVPEGVEEFNKLPSSLKKLEEIVFPSSLKSIGDEVFKYNHSLNKVTLPKGVKIGRDVFRINSGDFIYNIVSDENTGEYAAQIIDYIGASRNMVIFPEIDGYPVVCFKGDYHYYLEDGEYENTRDWGEFDSVVFPDSIKSIDLYGCYFGTQSITLPDHLENAEDLDQITLIKSDYKYNLFFNEETKQVEADISAADSYSGGDTFEIPDSVDGIKITGIANGGFIWLYCSELKIPGFIKRIGSSAFKGGWFTAVTIPDSVTEIGWGAFEDCSNLETVVLSNNISEISVDMFNNCTSLTNIKLPNGITEIAERAFQNCELLTNLTIPSTVRTIRRHAFLNSGLKGMEIPSTVTQVGRSLFEDEEGDDISQEEIETTVPRGSLVSGDFAYVLSDDGVHITRYLGSSESVVIPSTLAGKTVTGLEEDVFYVVHHSYPVTGISGDYLELGVRINPFVKTVTLPSTLNYIDGTAFRSTDLVEGNFSYKYKLNDVTQKVEAVVCGVLEQQEELKIPDNINGNPVTEISSISTPNSYWGRAALGETIASDYEEKAYSHNEEYHYETEWQVRTDSILKHVEIPDSVKTIGAFAFANCISLQDIIIPNSVECIECGAFYHCNSLREINIPASVTSFKTDMLLDEHTYLFDATGWTYFDKYIELTSPFICCDNLTRINVDSNNPSFTSVDGVLFTKDMTGLIQYPTGKADKVYTVPNSVKTIIGNHMGNPVLSVVEGAFSYNTELEQIILPEGLEEIGSGAFAGCISLERLDFPKSVTAIGLGILEETNAAPENVSAGIQNWEIRKEPVIGVYKGTVAEQVMLSYQFNVEYLDDKPLPTSDTESDTSSDEASDTESYTDYESDISTDSEINSEYAVSTDSDTDFESDSLTDSDTESETDITTDSDTNTESETDTTTDSETDTDDTYTYYFLAPYDWFDTTRGAYNEDVGAYYWYDDDNTPVAWPGVKMVSCPDIGKNVFKIEGVPADMAYIIFNAYFNVGRNSTPEEIAYAHQTDNLSLGGYKKGECPYDSELTTENFNGWICVCDCTDLHENAINVCYNTGSAWFTLDDYKKYSDYYGTYDIGDDQPIGVLGDVDSDSEITANDALTILRSSVGMESFTPEQTKLADVDNDTEITANDALAVLRYSVGLTDENSPINKPVAA